MTGISLEQARDAFRRFFPEEWLDHLRAWMARHGIRDDQPGFDDGAQAIERKMG